MMSNENATETIKMPAKGDTVEVFDRPLTREDSVGKGKVLIEALVLAVTAPTDDGHRRAVHLAGSIAAGLRRIDVQMCQLDAKRKLDRM